MMQKHRASSLLFLIFSLVLTPLSQALQPREGDVLGETEISVDPTTSFFEVATASRYGHVGIVFRDQQNWVVYEETPPKAQVVPLRDFLKRSQGIYSVIRRKHRLNHMELAKLKEAAKKVVALGIPYNHSQTMNNDSLNCAEFVRFVFAKAGIEVGEIQTVGELNLRAFHGYLWLLWQKIHPQTTLADKIISPKSIMQTPSFRHVAGPIHPNVNESDVQLVSEWKNENALEKVAKTWHLTPEQVEKLAQP